MSKRKRKTPDEIAAELLARRMKDFDAVNMAPSQAALATFSDVEIERLGRKAGGNRAWRSNVFRLLFERKTITIDHYMMAQKLAEEWATWKGLDGKADTFGAYVDGGAGSVELVTDRMIRAGKDVARALDSLETLDRRIVVAFMVATVEEDRAMAWRGVLERLGVLGKERQTNAVVAALEALRAHYQEAGRVAA